MRSKYLRKLLELVREMDEDYRHNNLDLWSKDLRAALHMIFIAFWFFQVDELWSHMVSWKLRVLGGVVFDDSVELAQNFLAVELAEQAAAEIDAEEKAGRSGE